MALEVINTGTAANSGDGDNLRAFATKAKNNFAEIYADDFVTSARIADDVALGGNPTTTTQTAGDNSTKIATTAYADTAVANAIDAAPAALDTLNELAASLNDDADFAGTMTTSLAGKLSTDAGAVGTSNLADSAVTTAKITDANVTTAKIADDAVTADKLANSINTEIAANTAKVTNATHTGDVTGATALTIANDAVSHDKLENRYTAQASITTLTGTVSFDCSTASSFKLSGNLTGAYTINLSNYKKGQVITIYPLQAQSVTLAAQGSSTNTFNKIGSDYDNTTSSILQIECVDDSATDPVFFYSIATFASDSTL